MKGSISFKMAAAEDLERVIEKSDTSSSVNSDEIKPSKTLRERVKHAVQTKKFQIIIITLVIINCIVVITELLIDLNVFASFNATAGVSTSAKGPEASFAAVLLHYISIGILILFVLEMLIKVIVMGKDFFNHRMEIVDSIIVILCFALDIALAHREGISSALGLLVALRLWRVTTILSGIVMSVKNQSEKRVLRELRLREAADKELSKFRDYCAALEREIETLQQLLRDHNIEFKKMDKPPLCVSTIDVIADVNFHTESSKLASPPMLTDK